MKVLEKLTAAIRPAAETPETKKKKPKKEEAQAAYLQASERISATIGKAREVTERLQTIIDCA